MHMKIAIIGAGLSGATAAQALHTQGHDVAVFDKGRGVGGRMSSRRTAAGAIDHGAQYFTAQSQPFHDCVAQWVQAGWAQVWSSPVVSGEGAERRLSESVTRYIGTPQMSSPIKGLLQGLQVHVGHAVTQVERQEQQWWLRVSEQGAALGPFDAVIASVPLPQLHALFNELPQAWLSAWQQIEMTPCWAVMMDWAQGAPDNFGGWFVNDPFVDWIANNHRKPGRITHAHWTLHATESWSEQHVDATPEFVMAQTRMWLSQRGWSQQPPEMSAHRWRYARSRGASQQPSHWSADLGLGVVGDWLGGGRVEGAWQSAQHLLSAMGVNREQ